MPKPDLIVALGDARYLIERPFGSWPQNAGFVTDVTVDARGHVFVMLRHDPLTQPDDPRVVELSPEGEYLGGWGGDLIADSHMLTVDAQGRILCVDRDMHEIVICSATGERLGGLGQRGEPLSPFNHPTDVHVLGLGRHLCRRWLCREPHPPLLGLWRASPELGRAWRRRGPVRLAARALDPCRWPRRRRRPHA